MKKTGILLLLLIFISSATWSQAGFEELAQTPPMGWNSWNTFRLNINEELVREVADIFIEKGLKFGIYSDAGYMTCGKFPGSLGHEYQDAQTYAKLGVDYLKYDWCHTGNMSAPDSYKLMKDALVKAGRPIVFSICECGTSQPWTWAPGVGNLWRTTFDIRPCWDCGEMVMSKGKQVENFMGFTKILDLQVGLESYSGPGHWNDPDMLGNDIRSMSNEVLEIITNTEVIAVNQDPLGRQVRKVRDDGDLEVWSRELHDGSRAVVLFNRSEKETSMDFTWSEAGLPRNLVLSVRDLWLHEDLGKFSGSFDSTVPSHGVVMVRVF